MTTSAPKTPTEQRPSPLAFLGLAAVTALLLLPRVLGSDAAQRVSSPLLAAAYIVAFACLGLFLADTWIRPLPRTTLLAAVAAATASLLAIYGLGYFPYLDMNGDNAGYILRAQSLLQGKGFRDLHLPGEPWNHPLYNIGWSLLLVPFLALFGLNHGLLNLAPLLFTFASFPLVYLLAKRLLPRGLALATALLTALNQELLHFSSLVMTENPSIFFTLLSLVLLLRYEHERKTIAPLLWISAASVFFAFLVRFANIPLAAASVLGLAVRRQFRKAVALSAVLAMLFAAFFGLRKAVQHAYPQRFKEIPSMEEPPPSSSPIADASRLLSRPMLESLASAALVLPEKMLDYPYKTQEEYRTVVLRNLLVLAVVLWGAFLAFKSGHTAPPLHLILFSGLVVVTIAGFPTVDLAVMSRYFIPLIPLLYLFLLLGLERLRAAVTERIPSVARLAPLAAGLLALLLGAKTLDTLSVGVAQSRQGLPPAYANYLRLAEWVRANLPQDAVLAGRKDNIFSLASGRKTVMYYYQGTKFSRYDSYSAEMDELTHRKFRELPVHYVVFDTFSGDAFNKLLPILRRSPGRFRTVTAFAGRGQSVTLPERWWMDDETVTRLARAAAAVLLAYSP